MSTVEDTHAVNDTWAYTRPGSFDMIGLMVRLEMLPSVAIRDGNVCVGHVALGGVSSKFQWYLLDLKVVMAVTCITKFVIDGIAFGGQ